MKNRNFFGISPSLMLEDLKLHWYIPALTFLGYFLSSIIRLFQAGQFRTSIVNTLQNQNILNIFFMTAVPFFTALIMLEYLHNSRKSLVLHAQPYSRNKLFNTQVLTGWLMFVVPIVLIAVLFIVLRPFAIANEADFVARAFSSSTNSLFVPDTNSSKITCILPEAYTVSSVLTWLIGTIGSMTFLYGIFVLMGSISGNVALHIIMSFVGFFIMPLIGWIISIYQQAFFTTYAGSSKLSYWLMTNTNPMFKYFVNMDLFTSIKLSIIYVGVGIVLVFVAKFAISKAKLENTGSGIFFKIIENVITGLACFVGMTGFGFFFQVIMNSDNMIVFHIGMLIGIMLAFFLVKLVCHRTAKIFNKENLKVFAIILLLAIVFNLFAVYDISGFSKRLPNANKIESVDITDFVAMYQMYDYNPYFLEVRTKLGLEYDKDDNAVWYSDPTFISKVYDLQRYIVYNELYKQGDSSIFYSDSDYGYIRIVYTMKNGSKFARKYEVRFNEKVQSMVDDLMNDIGFDPEAYWKDIKLIEERIDTEEEPFITDF